jgi:hypothetical protein
LGDEPLAELLAAVDPLDLVSIEQSREVHPRSCWRSSGSGQWRHRRQGALVRRMQRRPRPPS